MENAQVVWLLTAALLLASGACQLHSGGGGYSFSSFTGPVSGAVRAVPVARGHAAHHHHHPAASLDYVAKPDYSFAYGVDDPSTGNSQKHRETRDGDVVQGEYTVLEADGSVRTVTYTADATNGFQATVHQSAPNPASRPPAPRQQHAYYDY